MFLETDGDFSKLSFDFTSGYTNLTTSNDGTTQIAVLGSRVMASRQSNQFALMLPDGTFVYKNMKDHREKTDMENVINRHLAGMSLQLLALKARGSAPAAPVAAPPVVQPPLPPPVVQPPPPVQQVSQAVVPVAQFSGDDLDRIVDERIRKMKAAEEALKAEEAAKKKEKEDLRASVVAEIKQELAIVDKPVKIRVNTPFTLDYKDAALLILAIFCIYVTSGALSPKALPPPQPQSTAVPQQAPVQQFDPLMFMAFLSQMNQFHSPATASAKVDTDWRNEKVNNNRGAVNTATPPAEGWSYMFMFFIACAVIMVVHICLDCSQLSEDNKRIWKEIKNA